MPTFTVYLKEITGNDGEPDFSRIGLDTYPIYEETYRATLNGKIWDQFANREIGQESVQLFRHAFRRWMNNNMPYYNDQYRLSLVKIDPLLTMSMVSSSDSTGTTEALGESNNKTKVDSESDALASNYPQTFIREDGVYATDGQKTKANTSSNADATEKQNSTQSGKVEATSKGFSGHAPALIFQARQALINIDLLILDEIEKAGIFFMLWNNGDDFTDGNEYNYGI